SSDADFTPLVMRLLTDGMKVYGFGEKKTPMPFVNACSKFTYVEALGTPAADNGQASTTAPKDPQELRNDARLVQMLRSAVDAGSGDDGWTRLDVVGSQIGNQASFDPRNYGYRKLSDLVKATGLIEMREEGKTLWVREKPRRRGPAKKKAGSPGTAAAPVGTVACRDGQSCRCRALETDIHGSHAGKSAIRPGRPRRRRAAAVALAGDGAGGGGAWPDRVAAFQ